MAEIKLMISRLPRSLQESEWRSDHGGASQFPPALSMAASEPQKRKEIYTYEAPWLIYGMNWSVRAEPRFRLAVGSFEEEYSNKVRLVQLDEAEQKFIQTAEFDHPYPTTKIMWIPDPVACRPDMLATTGDYLRLWNVNDNKSVRLECLLNNNKNTEFCAPLTSFDWNEQDPNLSLIHI